MSQTTHCCWCKQEQRACICIMSLWNWCGIKSRKCSCTTKVSDHCEHYHCVLPTSHSVQWSCFQTVVTLCFEMWLFQLLLCLSWQFWLTTFTTHLYFSCSQKNVPNPTNETKGWNLGAQSGWKEDDALSCTIVLRIKRKTNKHFFRRHGGAEAPAGDKVGRGRLGKPFKHMSYRRC